MRWSIRLARIAGIDVKIHLTFLIFLVWIGAGYYAEGGRAAAGAGLAFTLLLFLCVLLHEFGHAMAARRYGIATQDITLLPIGGVARIARMPRNPTQELVIAAAGPLVNLVIAAALFLFRGGADLSGILSVQSSGPDLVSKLLTVNLWLVLFNLIPAFPMDGGRILRAFLALRLPYARATSIAASVGQAAAFGFGFLGLLYNPMLLFIALFVYLGATQEAAQAQLRDVSERLPVSAAMINDFRSLGPDARLRDAVDLLLQTSQHEFPVVDGSERVVGVLTRDDLIGALRRSGLDLPVSEVARKSVPVVSPHMALEKALELLERRESPVVMVIHEDGRLAGLVTPENIGELLLVQSALGRTKRSPAWTGSPMADVRPRG